MSSTFPHRPAIGQTLVPGARVYLHGAEQTAQLQELARAHGLEVVNSPSEPGCAALITFEPDSHATAGPSGPSVYTVSQFLGWAGSHALDWGQSNSGPFMGFVDAQGPVTPPALAVPGVSAGPGVPDLHPMPNFSGAPLTPPDLRSADPGIPYGMQRFAPPAQRSGRPPVVQNWSGNQSQQHLPPHPEYGQVFINPGMQTPDPYGVNERYLRDRFHWKMALTALILLLVPFSVAVIFAMVNLPNDWLITVILLGWLALIIQLIAWPIVARRRRRSATGGQGQPSAEFRQY